MEKSTDYDQIGSNQEVILVRRAHLEEIFVQRLQHLDLFRKYRVFEQCVLEIKEKIAQWSQQSANVGDGGVESALYWTKMLKAWRDELNDSLCPETAAKYEELMVLLDALPEIFVDGGETWELFKARV